MSRIRSKDTDLEKKFRKIIWTTGLRYRKNSSNYFGKPDIVIAKSKTVIFIDSCFWHGCKKHCRMPKTNRSYWINKIKNNKKRDKLVNAYYQKIGWKIIRVWGHSLKNAKGISKISQELGS